MVKVIKKINNNVAVCLDSNGEEMVAFGKGIGFPKIPYELTDLSKIDMTFYRLNHSHFTLMNEIPEKIVELSAEIVRYAQTVIRQSLNPNVIFTLADHIHFANKRMDNNQVLSLPFSYDIKQLYPLEYKVGLYAVSLLNNQLGEKFPDSEAALIAMHIVNAQEQTNLQITEKIANQILQQTVGIIENYFHIKIDQNEFSYNRFLMHLRYFLKRIQDKEQLSDTSSVELFRTFKKEEPDIYHCTQEIVVMIDDLLKTRSTDEEIFYLMIYVKRIVQQSKERSE